MSIAPVPDPQATRLRHVRLATLGRRRVTPPSATRMARRRLMLRLTKLLLPAAALALLASIALWPEFDRATDNARVSLGKFSGELDGARVVDARYRGVDEHGEPYTLTASVAQQSGPDRVNLTNPDGDINLSNHSWISVTSKDGVYFQQSKQLDLSHHVVLYRDDGTTLRTESVSVNLDAGAAAGGQKVHAEGPFGTLDAQGFTLTDRGTVIHFVGPATLVLNGADQ